MYLLVYIILYMLPHTIILMCAFQLSLVKSLVEMLLLLVQELDLLVNGEFDCFDCSFVVLLSSTVDFDIDIVGF